MSAVTRVLGSVAACSALLLSSALFAPTASAQPTEAAPAAPEAALKVAIIDSQKVLRETEEGMRIESNLRKIFDSKQADIFAKQKQLSQEYEDLAKDEKAQGGKPSAALEKRKNEFKVKYAAYEQAAVDFQREFQRKQNELYSPMLQKVYAIVKTIAQESNFAIVIEKQAAVYFRRDLDITERVIQAYNQGDPGTATDPKKKKAAPAAPAPAPAAPAPKGK